MFHNKSAQEVIKEFQTDAEKGLNLPEVKKRLTKYGSNTLPTPKKPSLILKFLHQFTDLLVLILLFATVAAFALGETIDALVILAIVAINATIGFFQEIQAERTIEALADKEILYSLVLRDGQMQKIPAQDIVPGDVLIIEEGEKIPADARVIESFSLRVDESILTGESTPTDKEEKALAERNLPIADCKNMVYKNTEVLAGRGKAVVITTGRKTEIGKIATTLETTRREKTPLTIELEKVAKILTIIIGIIAISIFILNFLAKVPLIQSLLVSISLSVAAIPEGLPAIVTIVLSLGVKKLAEKKSIVKRLASVESLGSVRIIATDKTGTLTQNKINVVRIILDTGQEYTVEGQGYKTKGDFFDKNGKKIDPGKISSLYNLLKASVLVSNAALKATSQNQKLRIKNSEMEVIGDTTEGALLVAAARAGLDIDKVRKKFSRIYEVPFSAERKMMSVAVKTEKPGKYLLYVKGAPEVVIAKSKLGMREKKEFFLKTQQLTYEGLRTLAVAQKIISQKQVDEAKEKNNLDEGGLELIGLIGMHDPLRPEVANALKLAKDAGIRTIMITGDHQDTASAIAEKAGIIKRGEKVLTDCDLEQLSNQELAQLIKKEVSVFARISPLSKLRLIEAIKSLPYTQVAVTGDGVNDAPALKAAHIGVAMGQTGTDLTREVADMVLTDDNYATIVTAIEQGRVIYANLVKFIRYLISCNLAEVFVVTLGVIFSPGLLPLFPIQILWINLITDSLPALALGVDPPETDVMKQPPRDPSLGILHKLRLIYMTIEGSIMGLTVFALFLFSLSRVSYQVAQSMTFAALALSQLTHAFNNRSTRQSLFTLGVFTNKYLVGAVFISFMLQFWAIQTAMGNVIFKTVGLDISKWLIVVLVSLVPFVFVEIKKFLRFRILP